MAKRIRKQCCDLTAQDFERFPIWEFALDEEGRPGQDKLRCVPHRFDAAQISLPVSFLCLAFFRFLTVVSALVCSRLAAVPMWARPNPLYFSQTDC